MDASTQTLRERMAGYMRWLLGRDMAERQQRQQVERNIPNGVIRQQQDPDYDLAQGQRTRQAPQGVTREGSEAFRERMRGNPAYQREMDSGFRPHVPTRTPEGRSPEGLSAQMDALQQRLDAQRQAEQEQQRRGHGQER